MKKLLFISLTCLIVATSLGQNKKDQKLGIPKKSNTIELTTTYKTRQEALNEIVKILLQEGIEPEKIDSSAFFITTGPHGIKYINAKLMFTITSRADTIITTLSGKFITHGGAVIGGVVVTPSWNKIEYKKGSSYRLSWDFMHKFTTLIPNKGLKYITK